MPALDSLPAPAIILSGNNGRWSKFPSSQNVQMELITRARQNLTAFLSAGTSTKNPPSASSSAAAALPRVLPKTAYANLGELIGQEQLAGTSQMLCHYQNKTNVDNFDQQQPISLICQLGCCAHLPGGCCTLDDAGSTNGVQSIASITNAYHWVLALLCAFILCVFFSTLAMLALYWANRRQQQRRRRFLLAEKYSLGIGSSSVITRPISYGAPSMASSSSNGQPPNAQPPFCGHNQIGGCGLFHQFYSANSPSQFCASAAERHPSTHQFGGPHLLRPYGYGLSNPNENMNKNNNNGSPASSSSAYHAPDEVFFRSSF